MDIRKQLNAVVDNALSVHYGKRVHVTAGGKGFLIYSGRQGYKASKLLYDLPHRQITQPAPFLRSVIRFKRQMLLLGALRENGGQTLSKNSL